MILDKIKNGLKKRKVKVFLLFLALSTLAWLVNNLSRSYTGNTTFSLVYVNTPENYLLADKPTDELMVKIKAVGFKLLGLGLSAQKIIIDLSQTETKNGRFFISPGFILQQVKSQLPNDIELLTSKSDTIFLQLMETGSKRVPVNLSFNFSLKKNFAVENKLRVEPEWVMLYGPKQKIDTIINVSTDHFDLLNVDKDVDMTIKIHKPSTWEHINVQPSKVKVTGKIYKFSEQVITIPVKMINVPKGVVVRTFPEQVKIICQGRLNDLKALKTTDFELIADYTDNKEPNSAIRSLTLIKSPPNIRNVTLNTKEIEFIVRKE